MIQNTKVLLLGRFSLILHDEMKAELLKLNAGDSEKLELVQQISQPVYEVLNAMKSPRFIKTHFPISLLPPKLLDVGSKVGLQIFFGDRTFDSIKLCLLTVKKERKKKERKNLQWLMHIQELRVLRPPVNGISTLLMAYLASRGACVY
jgi:hypothetical protein